MVSHGQQKMRVFTLGPHTHVGKPRAGHFLQIYRKLATSITFIARASVVELVSIRTEVAASSPLRWRIVENGPSERGLFRRVLFPERRLGCSPLSFLTVRLTVISAITSNERDGTTRLDEALR